MNYILKSWVKYYTKETFKALKIASIGSVIVLTIVCIKYKPAYKVTISGNTIGFISEKEHLDEYENRSSSNTENSDEIKITEA